MTKQIHNNINLQVLIKFFENIQHSHIYEVSIDSTFEERNVFLSRMVELTHEHFVHDDPERPPITGALVALLVLKDLWCNIVRCPHS